MRTGKTPVFTAAVAGWMVHVYPFEDSPEKIWRHH